MNASDILTYDEACEIRNKKFYYEDGKLKIDESIIIPQDGFQENVLSSPADIQIIGGSRGAGKSSCLLMEGLRTEHHPRANSIIIRREKGDLKGGLVKDSETYFSDFGVYGTSEMSWKFYSGAELKFEQISDEGKADQRFRGRAIPYIGIDEVNQISEETFWFLMTSNRNVYGLPNRIIGTCNPDIDSWVYHMVKWYLNEDGSVNKDRDSIIRYFYKHGKSMNEIIWGNTKDEVYRKAKTYIDKYFNEEHSETISKLDLIKSFQFIYGDVYQNKILTTNDPRYIGNIANNGEEAITRELLGVWRKFEDDEEIISAKMLDDIFENIPQTNGKGYRWITCDVAMEGGDKFIIWVWDDWHVIDIIVKQNISAPEILNLIRATAKKYGISNNRIIYDAIGMGEFLGSRYKDKGFIPNSIPYKSNESPKDKNVFFDLNAELLNEYRIKIIDKQISFSEEVLNKVISIKDKGGKIILQRTISEILQHERKAMRWLKTGNSMSGKLRVITKKEMRKIIGGSPDLTDALRQRLYGERKKTLSNTIRYIY